MAETITVTGLDEVQKRLYSYSQQLGDRVVLGALRQGANLVKKAAQANAPVLSGTLKQRGIVVRKSKIHRGKSSKDLIGVYLTIAGKKKSDPAYRTKDDPYYGKFLETGWNTRGKSNDLRYSKRIRGFTRRSVGGSRVTQRGRTDVPGRHFIDRAFESNKEQAVELIGRSAIAASDVLARKVGL